MAPRAISKHQLTKTENDIRRLVARGYTNKDIAKATGLTAIAVKARLQRLYERLWVANRAALAGLRLR